ETSEDFSHRVECCIADYLGVKATNFTHGDAAEAAKRHLHTRTIAQPVKRTVDSRMLDEIAMRIKQSYPSVTLFDIRMDLERSRDQQSTIERIKSGNLSTVPRIMGKVPADPSQWKRLFIERKWTLIETNRQRYLARLNKLIGAGDQ
ncbi:CUE domain protein, partial [Ancylostoma ceylanicum]